MITKNILTPKQNSYLSSISNSGLGILNSSTNKITVKYNWNIDESDVKRHNQGNRHVNCSIIMLHVYTSNAWISINSTSYSYSRKMISLNYSLRLLPRHIVLLHVNQCDTCLQVTMFVYLPCELTFLFLLYLV